MVDVTVINAGVEAEMVYRDSRYGNGLEMKCDIYVKCNIYEKYEIQVNYNFLNETSSEFKKEII